MKLSSISSLRIIIALCIALLFSLPMFAQASNYSVSPLVVDREVEKRDILVETITITNNDAHMIRIYPTVNEIALDEGGAIKTFVEPSMTADKTSAVTTWLEISRARLEIAPGEKKEIELTIRVNPDVAAGEYHAFVGFPEGSNRGEAEAKVYAGNAQGTVVRIGVDKVQNQFLRLARFSVEKFIKQASEGAVTYALDNPGEDPVIPQGEIIFYDNNGNEVSSVPINPDKTVIEGKKKMDFTSMVPEDLKMGKYKAFLSVEYGDHQTASVHDTAFFYVLPLWNVVIIFVVVLIAALALALYVHRKYDLGGPEVDADDVALYIREGRSESKEHDIDLSKKQ
jgi:hypothetical protein